ncbi:MAG: TonB-dependent receptor, partial [Bacteroidetes bacterium]|nr:TonB-dependent receptor [Bacteroidota bacterium]
DAFELNYRYPAKMCSFSVQTYFRNTTSSFTAIRTLGNDGIMYHELTNAKDQQSAGVELGADLSLFKWWQVNAGTNLYHYTIRADVYSTPESKSTDTWDARLVSNFALKWGTRFQATAYYRAPTVDVQGKSTDFYVVNLAVSQSFMKGKANLSLVAQNIFDSVKFTYTSVGQNFDNNYVIHGEGAVFMLNFSYAFNNFQQKQRGRTDEVNFKGGGAF